MYLTTSYGKPEKRLLILLISLKKTLKKKGLIDYVTCFYITELTLKKAFRNSHLRPKTNYLNIKEFQIM